MEIDLVFSMEMRYRGWSREWIPFGEPEFGLRVSGTFRNWYPDQTWPLPPSPRDWLESNHLVYFLLDVVREMDLTPFFERYRNSLTGQPPYHPA